MNKGVLSATSSWKTKYHFVESQTISLFWPYLSYRKITQLIIWSFLMNQSVSLTALEICLGIQQMPRFCRGRSKFSRKNVFLFKKEKKCSVLWKNYFCLSRDFHTCFHNADHFMFVFSFHTFLFSYIIF